MKTALRLLFLLGPCLLGGCYSFETSTSSVTGERHAIVMNYGWHLFNTFPLICGNTTPEPDRCGPWAWFRDDVTFENTQKRFMEEIGTMNGEVTDMSYWVRENFLYEIPFLQVPLPIPYLLTYREIQLSGVLK